MTVELANKNMSSWSSRLEFEMAYDSVAPVVGHQGAVVWRLEWLTEDLPVVAAGPRKGGAGQGAATHASSGGCPESTSADGWPPQRHRQCRASC